MARHRSSAARRQVSRGPIIIVGLLVVVALVVFGWLQVGHRVNAQRVSAADSCVSGPATLEVAATAAMAPALTELARRFTARKTVIRDHCIEVAVHATSDQQALAGLQGNWDSATMGVPPAAWVPQDTSWTARLAASTPALLADRIPSLAASPLVLAVPQPVAPAMTAAKFSWGQLPTLQGASDGWARFGQPSWGRTTIATPTGLDGSTAAAMTVQAVAAGVSGSAPVTTDVLARPDVAAALNALRLSPAPQPASTAAALSTIRGLPTLAGSAFQAVPATEQQVFTAARQPGNTDLAAVAPAGPTPMADYPYAGIRAPWVDDAQSRAAGAFGEFLGQPEQQQVLADAGFRAGDARLPPADAAVSFPPLATPVPAPNAATRAATETLLAAPPVTPAPPITLTTTVLLDVSASMSARENNSTRLADTTRALGTRIGELPDAVGIGLWTFSTDLNGGLPYRVDVPTGALAEAGRRQNLQTALGSLTPKTGTSLNFSIGAAYTSAVQAFAAGHPNSVLVVTDGRNDGRTTLSELRGIIDQARVAAKPVRIDVLSIGAQPDITALRQLTDQTGGTVVQTGVNGGTPLSAAMAQLLS